MIQWIPEAFCTGIKEDVSTELGQIYQDSLSLNTATQYVDYPQWYTYSVTFVRSV